MPTVSPAQHRLMEGVAHNPAFAKKVGIPQHVGKEFVSADAIRAQGAGTLFVDPDGCILLLKRSDKGDHGGEWCLPGGHIEPGETAQEAAKREALEELGTPYYPEDGKFFSRTQSSEGVDFSTFVCPVEARFVPKLNDEHTGHMWVPLDDLPAKLHPGVRASLSPVVPGEDMKPEDWKGLVHGFLKFIKEEEAEPEHADDEIVTTLPKNGIHYAPGAKKFLDQQAYDLASVRTYTVEGHLHVARTPISKANVCEYYGREIPGAEALGLMPNRKYRLLRDPEELRRAAASSNGKPLLITHESSEADDHPKELTVGALGTDAEFEDPYLYNSLSVWDGDAIAGIEDKSRRQLSAGYRYRADMTPGTFRGAPYDGVMRDIIFNHEALVPAGRAGADVLVGDEHPNETVQPGEIVMKTVLSRKALYLAAGVSALLAPRLAQDASIDLGALFDGVSAQNLAEKKPGIVKALKSVKLAKDQVIDPVLAAFDAMEKEEVAEGADANPSSGLPMNAAEMEKKAKDEAEEKAKKAAEDAKAAADKAAKDKRAKDKKARDKMVADMKKGKDEKTCAAIDELMSKLDGMDAESERATENEEGKEGGGGEDKRRGHDSALTQQAMDEALATQRTQLREAAEAREFVEPWIGKVSLAMDSAPDIYKLALDTLKVDVKNVHPSAFKAVLQAQPKPGDAQRTVLAQDTVIPETAGITKRFGSLTDRIGHA